MERALSWHGAGHALKRLETENVDKSIWAGFDQRAISLCKPPIATALDNWVALYKLYTCFSPVSLEHDYWLSRRGDKPYSFMWPTTWQSR